MTTSELPQTVTLARADDEATETMIVTRRGNEITVTSMVDADITDERVMYDGNDPDSWLRDRLIDWKADGWQEG